jgi:hypothetical protein
MRNLSTFVVLSIVILTTFSITACGCNDLGGNGGASSDVNFPHYPDARQLDTAWIDRSSNVFASSEAVTTLHASSAFPMSISSYYTMELVSDGWTLRGGKATQNVSTSILVSGMRIAKVVLIPGVVVSEQPSVLPGVGNLPFTLDDQQVSSGEVLIYTEIATCEEATIEACVSKVQ